ncbi:MAG: hypothetical protein MZV64_30840 [Ignavibacteriales bacterium]|nr:hypothetical protein [Ignavibacteriales bacterium]
MGRVRQAQVSDVHPGLLPQRRPPPPGRAVRAHRRRDVHVTAARRCRRTSGESGLTASREMERLSLIEQFADLRRVALFHPVVMLAHALGLPRAAWNSSGGSATRGAAPPALVRRTGRVRCARRPLAWLQHDNPEWAFPEVDEAASRGRGAPRLGHPLHRRRPAGAERRDGGAARRVPDGHRVEHVGQEHAAARASA